jgi:hypothetical protein
MPQYIKFEDVRLRLIGKVRFADTIEEAEESGKMFRGLAMRLIDEAEGQVETDLSPRYAVPFVHKDTGKFQDIPDRPTKNLLRTLCELKACVRILETDFGSGTAIDGEKYIKKIQDRYKDIISNNVLAKLKDKEDTRQWAFPPLPDLKKNYMNTEADDGYPGMVMVTSSGDGDYPSKQVNDPSESWFNANFSDEDGTAGDS